MVGGALEQLKLISRDDQELKIVVPKFIENTNTKLETQEDTEEKNYDLLKETCLPPLKIRKKNILNQLNMTLLAIHI